MKAIKVRIYPNQKQREMLEQHFGCCRWIYNHGLSQKIEFYNKNKKGMSTYAIINQLPSLKKTNPWLSETAAQALQQTLRDLDSAFSHFFKKTGKFPRFKSKKNPKQSFRIPQGFKIFPDTCIIKLPKIGRVRFRDKFDFGRAQNLRSITISKNSCNQYYASILYDTPQTVPALRPVKFKTTVGVDLGVKTFATLSDGTKIENPRHLGKKLARIAREQYKLSKKTKDSKNHEKSKLKIAKLHLRVRNSRADFLSKTSTQLVENQDWHSVAIEDLSVQKMQANAFSKLSQLIGDAGWSMFRNMLEYKCREKGKNLLIINRFEPSSKTCSCGHLYEELKLSERQWTCKKCGVTHDRDILAANNIRLFATAGHAVPSGQPL